MPLRDAGYRRTSLDAVEGRGVQVPPRAHTPSDTITQSEIWFRSLPLIAAGCQVDTTESSVSEVKLSGGGTPTSFC